jgi:hypothetical protein
MAKSQTAHPLCEPRLPNQSCLLRSFTAREPDHQYWRRKSGSLANRKPLHRCRHDSRPREVHGASSTELHGGLRPCLYKTEGRRRGNPAMEAQCAVASPILSSWPADSHLLRSSRSSSSTPASSSLHQAVIVATPCCRAAHERPVLQPRVELGLCAQHQITWAPPPTPSPFLQELQQPRHLCVTIVDPIYAALAQCRWTPPWRCHTELDLAGVPRTR